MTEDKTTFNVKHGKAHFHNNVNINGVLKFAGGIPEHKIVHNDTTAIRLKSEHIPSSYNYASGGSYGNKNAVVVKSALYINDGKNPVYGVVPTSILALVRTGEVATQDDVLSSFGYSNDAEGLSKF
jgi:hypothetical protein